MDTLTAPARPALVTAAAYAVVCPTGTIHVPTIRATADAARDAFLGYTEAADNWPAWRLDGYRVLPVTVTPVEA